MDGVEASIEILKKVGFRRLQELGWHFQPVDYYSALNDCAFLEENPDLWAESEPLEIDWDLEGQLAVAAEVSRFVGELRDIPEHSDGDPTHFFWQNNFWNNADALVQYGLVRSRQPRRYIEIGCGFSSLLLARALARNERPCEVTLVEPYPNETLFAVLPASWTQRRVMLQRVPLHLFAELEPGDVLFYDGSHVAKSGSDVNWFFFRILPRIAPGVLVHLHDIFLPLDYPQHWIFERGQTWNEQYLLQAFLMHNEQWRVLIANRWLWRKRTAELAGLYQGVQRPHGCSLWMTRREPDGFFARTFRRMRGSRNGRVREGKLA